MGSLCLSCGFCCDGTLFARFFLDEHEASWARRVRLPIVDDAEGARLLQPCAALDAARRCGHYEERPKPCQVFVCSLHQAVESGGVSREEALKTIARVAELSPQVRGSSATTGEAGLDVYELGELVRRWFTMADNQPDASIGVTDSPKRST